MQSSVMKSVWLILFVVILVTGCNENDFTATNCYSCLKKLIQQEDPIEVWRYQLDGKAVYLLIPDCCDQFIKLFDSNYLLICSPSGGFSGHGDGLCPDFYQNSTDKELIWKR